MTIGGENMIDCCLDFGCPTSSGGDAPVFNFKDNLVFGAAIGAGGGGGAGRAPTGAGGGGGNAGRAGGTKYLDVVLRYSTPRKKRTLPCPR